MDKKKKNTRYIIYSPDRAIIFIYKFLLFWYKSWFSRLSKNTRMRKSLVAYNITVLNVTVFGSVYLKFIIYSPYGQQNAIFICGCVVFVSVFKKRIFLLFSRHLGICIFVQCRWIWKSLTTSISDRLGFIIFLT